MRQPFALTLAGETVYVLTHAHDVAEVNKNVEQLTYNEYITDMMQAFGATSKGAKKMWEPGCSVKAEDLKTPKDAQKPLVLLVEEQIRRQLLPGPLRDDLQAVLLQTICDSVNWENMAPKVVLSQSATDRKVSLLELTRGALLAGATRSFFGPALQELEPNMFSSFFAFDDLSWKLTYRVPRPFSNDMHAAKDVAQGALTKYFKMPIERRPGACWLVRTMEAEMKGQGIQESDIAAFVMMMYWVYVRSVLGKRHELIFTSINANAWKLCFWIFSHLLHNPELLHTVKAEVAIAMSETDLTPNQRAQRLEDTCPQLMAVFAEILRLVTSSVSVRNVVQPVTIGGKRLQKGSRLIIPYRQLLMDDRAFGADAADFDASRFLHSPGLHKHPSYRPYGSGTTYCPGRAIAKAEVLTTIALTLTRFDVARVGARDGGRPFPRLEEKRPCIGIMSPVDGDDVILRIRQTGA